jgi:ABC-2 type transport system permease protein
VVFVRAEAVTVRDPTWVLVTLSQPLFFLYLYGPLLRPASALPGFAPADPLTILVPGLLVQVVVLGALVVGSGLLVEIRAGVLDRLRATPAGWPALLVGRALGDVLTLQVQALLLVLLALPLGLEVHVARLALVLGLLGLLGFALVSLSYWLTLGLRTEARLGLLVNLVTTPLLLLAGPLLPMALAPAWLRGLSAANPLSYTLDAARSLLAGRVGDPSVLPGVLVTGTLALVGTALAARSFGRLGA